MGCSRVSFLRAATLCSAGLLALSVANGEPATTVASARARTVTLLFVPGEPSTVFWERDLGLRRADLERCEETGGAAGWFEACRAFGGFSNSFVNILIGESGARSDPEVLLRTKTETVRVIFRPADVQRTSAARAVIPPARVAPPALVALEAAEGNSDGGEGNDTSLAKLRSDGASPDTRPHGVTCSFAAPLPAGWRLVKREWRLARGPGEPEVNLEADLLTPARLAGFASARCLLVASDGVIDVAKETRVPASFLSETFPVAASPLRLDIAAASDVRADAFVGRAHPGERYGCRTVWPPLEGRADPCSSFRVNEGVFDTIALRGLPGAPLPGDPPSFLLLEFRREGNDEIVARLSVPTLLVAGVGGTAGAAPNDTRDPQPPPGPQAPAASASFNVTGAPRVRLERDFLAEHLECLDAAGAPIVGPVTWSARGVEIAAWQNAYLPSFLLASGEAYACSVDGATSAPFPYDETPAAFRAPSEIRFPADSASVPFRVRVAPAGAGGSVSPDCVVPTGFQCLEIPRTSTVTGERMFAVIDSRTKAQAMPPPTKGTASGLANGSTDAPLEARFSVPSPSGPLERVAPLVSGDTPPTDAIDRARETPLTFESGAWSCDPPTPSGERILEVRWFLGGEEARPQTGVGRSRYVPPEVNAPTPLTCLVETSDERGGGVDVLFGQTLLQPSGPSLGRDADPSRGGAPAPLLALLSAEGLPVEVRGHHEGAPLRSVDCTLASFGTSSFDRPFPCRLVGGAGGRKGTFTVRLLESAALRGELARELLSNPLGSDPFAPLSTTVILRFSTARASFTLEQPLSIAMPNRRPRARSFVHWIDAALRTHCLLVADDPDGNHLSATLSPRFQPQARSSFTTREIDRAAASLEGLVPPDVGTAHTGVLAAHSAFEGVSKAGCEAVVSDGTSLVARVSTPSDEASARALALSARSRFGSWYTPSTPSALSAQSEPSTREASSAAAKSTPSPTALQAIEPLPAMPTVLRARIAFDAAGTRAIALPLPASEKRLVACYGERTLCGAFFVSGGTLRAAVSSGVPGGEILLVLAEARSPAQLAMVSARVSNAVFVPGAGTPVGDCAQLLERYAAGGLPSYLSLATYLRVGRSDIPVPPARALAGLSAGADDLVCETSVFWKGLPTSTRTSSLREALVARRGSGPRRALGREARYVSSAPLVLPRSGAVSLPSLAAALEGDEGGLPVVPLATHWKVVSCRLEETAGARACDVDPATLLVRGLPRRDVLLDATINHMVLGRPRRVRVRQPFRALPSPLVPVFTGVTLRRERDALVCAVTSPLPGATFEYRFLRRFKALATVRTTSTELRVPIDPDAASEGDFACHVSWDGGAESALLTGASVALDIEGLCVAWEPEAEARVLPCRWPESAAGAGMDASQPAGADRDFLRRTLEAAGLSPRAWVKWILYTSEASWRQSILLPPSEDPNGDAGPSSATREARVRLPAAMGAPLCLVRNALGSDAAPGREEAPSPARVRAARPCTLLSPAESGAEPAPMLSNPAFTDASVGVPTPFLSDLVHAGSAARKALAALVAPGAQGAGMRVRGCALRCSDAPSCRDLAGAIASVTSVGAPAEGCSLAEAGPALPLPGALLELLVGTRDNSATQDAIPLGLVWP